MKTSAIIGTLLMGSLPFVSWATPVGDPSIFEKLLKIEKVEKKVPGPAAVSIVRDPTEVGTPVGNRGPKTVKFTLETQEVLGVLDASANTSFMYWTFNGKVPGPLLRARVGDTIEITLKNAKESSLFHSIDLHAVWGQGGGAALTSVGPGEQKSFVFKALTPGLFVYHCATPIIPQHISSGMYGMILIEPEGGLPKVDRELYVMQGDMYTEGSDSEKSFNQNALMDEHPTHVVMNGSAAALAANPMKVKVGDTVRIFFGVGGPNLTSSFHAIGGIFDKVYNQASLTATPVTDVQTTSVPPGGATMVEFTARVPAKYILVDHALTRLLKGNVAIIEAEGAADPEIFRAGSLK